MLRRRSIFLSLTIAVLLFASIIPNISGNPLEDILLLASSILRISGKPFEGDASAEQLFSKTNDGKFSAEGNNDTVKHVINNYRGNGDSTQAENSMHRKNIEIMTKQFFDEPFSRSVESFSASSVESVSSVSSVSSWTYSSSGDLSYIYDIWSISKSDSKY
ncbi:uncharacterized protein LOC125775312 [Bactrocera dorsalis]|uniref:Uncharacterized protein LOC125775312 n=1 Tax=Bactrocera dorsalis TaxID=27457 RepID=A0ABM3JNE8_BACDO|nr:uncharacterized protein LOC125775312 [Bactrocera dorsalis]